MTSRKPTRLKTAPARRSSQPLPSPTSREDDEPRVAALLSALRADPKLASVVEEFERARGQPGRQFGSNGLKADGKLFALFTQGTLVVKLPRGRVAELIADKVGQAFDPGHGRLMKEWLTVTSAKAAWVELTKEAFEFVRAARR
jgi:hypothetical protein